jgi:glycerophosphoryl diester phosphodiesterase
MMKLVLPALLCLLALQLNAQKLPAAKHPFIVVAHRGDHVEVPENTLAAYQKAIDHDIDYVEIDLRTTKDSQLVIMHDATVDRMTDGKGKVSELTFAQIQQLHVQNKMHPEWGTFSVPTFEQVLQLCYNKVHIYLDYKDADVATAYALITKYHMQDQVIVYINSEDQLKQWHKLVPTMPLMISLPDTIKTAEAVTNLLKQYPVALLDGDYSDYTADMIKAAKNAGIAVWPDIQSPFESKNWDKAIELGFDGLQTDHPQQLADYLKQKKLR